MDSEHVAGHVIRRDDNKAISEQYLGYESRWNFFVRVRRFLEARSKAPPPRTIEKGKVKEVSPFTPDVGVQPDAQHDFARDDTDLSFSISRPIPFTSSPRLYYFPLADGLILPQQWDRFEVVKEVIMQNFDKDSELCGKVAAFDLVISGHTAADAGPTIIISVPKRLQKQARKVVEKPHVKAQYKDHKPGFSVLCGPFRLLGRDGDNFCILTNPGTSLSGCLVIRQDTGEHISTVTCGLSIGGRSYALTAGHPFNSLGRILDLDDEKSGDERFGDEQFGDEESDRPSIANLLSDGDTSDGGNGDRPQAGRRNRRHHGFARPCSLTRTSDTPGPSDVTNPNLDWALMELDPGIWRTEPLLEPSCVLAGYHPPDPKKLRRVSVMMPFRGLRPGYIRPARTSIRNWGGRGQSSRLWTVTLLEELRDVREGLSGALVVDIETLHAYGYVVATNLLSDLYICSLEEALGQISNEFGSSNIKVWSGCFDLARLPTKASLLSTNHSFSENLAEQVTGNAASEDGYGRLKKSRYFPAVSRLMGSILSRSSSPSPMWIGKPEDSVGELAFEVTQSSSTRYYWELAGPAQTAWAQLGPEVAHELHRHRTQLESTSGNLCQCRMYMVGTTKKLSEPTLFFFSDDKAAEWGCRDVIQRSHILEKYPGLRLARADDAVHAQISGTSLLATTEMDQNWVNHFLPPTGPEQVVWALPTKKAFGRRLFIPIGGESVRPATGGPILRVGDRVLQLTVGHVFRHTVVTQSASEPVISDDNSIPQGPLAQLGKLSMLPDDDAGVALDYALVELEDPHLHDRNLLPVAAGVQSRVIMATDFDDIPDRNTKVVTMTASTGFVDGSLSGIPSYVRLPGTHGFQALYPVRLAGILRQGDCGSTVVNQRNGKIYGHIVCGRPGSGLAYIMPATTVVQDINKRLRAGCRVVLNGFRGPEKLNSPALPLASHTSYGESNHQHLDFASKRFLEQMNPGLALKSEKLRQQNSDDKKQSLTTGILPDPLGILPPEILSQIFGNLPPSDTIQLQVVSQSWHLFITHYGKLIAKHCRRTGRIPRLIFVLYPVNRASASRELDMRYMVEVEHRVYQAESLSRFIAGNLAVDMFLQKSRQQRREFEHARLLMQQRILPLLLILSHFLETYRGTLLQACSSLSQCDINRAQQLASLRGIAERRIMAQYTNQALLEAHQFFPILLSYLQRLLRPPSYLTTIERAILKPSANLIPSAEVHVAILCIGGLPLLLKLATAETLNHRLKIVNQWYRQKCPDSKTLDPVFSSPSQVLFQGLPSSPQQLWLGTAEKLLLERNVWGRIQDFLNSGQVLGRLIISNATCIDFFLDGIGVLQV